MSWTGTTEYETDSSLTVLANISEAEPLSCLSERYKFFQMYSTISFLGGWAWLMGTGKIIKKLVLCANETYGDTAYPSTSLKFVKKFDGFTL